LPVGHAFPLLEWTLNWCITSHDFEHLVLHAAVVERGGRVAILPAPPGSGKSTLCAALIHRGWRLLSDELALISLVDGRLSALARPVSLKNHSIALMRSFAPDAVFSAETHDTSKGTVAHMRVPREQVRRMDETAAPAWVVFPRWVSGAAPQLVERPKADALMELGRNAFNYATLGKPGFDALCGLVTASRCFDFSYGQLDDAIEVFDGLVREDRR
jgi:HprK-related kinase A